MLSQKQITFCNLYCQGKTPQEAAKAAGYANWTWEGSRQLSKEEIQKYIDKLNAKVNQLNVMTIEEIQSSLSKIALGEENEKRRNSNGEIYEVPATLTTRMKAMELLGKSKGMFLDRIDINSPLKITIGVDENE